MRLCWTLFLHSHHPTTIRRIVRYCSWYVILFHLMGYIEICWINRHRGRLLWVSFRKNTCSYSASPWQCNMKLIWTIQTVQRSHVTSKIWILYKKVLCTRFRDWELVISIYLYLLCILIFMGMSGNCFRQWYAIGDNRFWLSLLFIYVIPMQTTSVTSIRTFLFIRLKVLLNFKSQNWDKKYFSNTYH